MTIRQPFAPHYGATVSVSPAAASATVSTDAMRENKQVRFVNTGVNICFVRTFDSRNGGQSATVADFPVAPNSSSTITKDESHDSVAHISAAGTTLLITPGEGF